MTDDMESKLTDAMKGQARNVEPADEQAALARITDRVNARRRRGFVVLGVAAALFVLLGSVLLLRRDDGSDQVRVTSDPSSQSSSSTTESSSSETTTTSSTASSSTPASSSSEPTTTTVAPTTIPPPAPPPPHVWPLSDATTYDTPEAAAQSFVVEYLGMTNARVGATNGNVVEIFANSRTSIRTLVDVADSSAGWVVVGARADEIVVDQPQPYADPSSPMTVSGTSTAFEAQLGLQLRLAGSTTVVGEGTAMGGSNGEMGPFSTTMDVPPGDAPLVLIVFEDDASGEQTFSKASVILLRVGSPQTASDGG